MKKIIKLSLFLGIVSLIAAFALMLANNVTAPIIKENQIQQTNKSLKSLYQDATEFKEEIVNEGVIKSYYLAYQDQELLGYVYNIKTQGYQSLIEMLVAIDLEGNYQGLEIISQAETSGYGSQITNDSYLDQFKTKSIKDEIDTITGSTITTTATKKAIEEVVSFHEKQ
ncbi:MAG: FMN-binding protein [Bacilli bacterium]